MVLITLIFNKKKHLESTGNLRRAQNHHNHIVMIPWWYWYCSGDDTWCIVYTKWYQLILSLLGVVWHCLEMVSIVKVLPGIAQQKKKETFRKQQWNSRTLIGLILLYYMVFTTRDDESSTYEIKALISWAPFSIIQN